MLLTIRTIESEQMQSSLEQILLVDDIDHITIYNDNYNNVHLNVPITQTYFDILKQKTPPASYTDKLDKDIHGDYDILDYNYELSYDDLDDIDLFNKPELQEDFFQINKSIIGKFKKDSNAFDDNVENMIHKYNKNAEICELSLSGNQQLNQDINNLLCHINDREGFLYNNTELRNKYIQYLENNLNNHQIFTTEEKQEILTEIQYDLFLIKLDFIKDAYLDIEDSCVLNDIFKLSHSTFKNDNNIIKPAEEFQEIISNIIEGHSIMTMSYEFHILREQLPKKLKLCTTCQLRSDKPITTEDIINFLSKLSSDTLKGIKEKMLYDNGNEDISQRFVEIINFKTNDILNAILHQYNTTVTFDKKIIYTQEQLEQNKSIIDFIQYKLLPPLNTMSNHTLLVISLKESEYNKIIDTFIANTTLTN